MRDLWAGDFVSHRGRHYTVDTARIYTRTESPPPVYVSAFGPKAVEVAARIGDGYVTTSPDKAMVQAFRSAAGANKPIQGGFKVSYADTADEVPRSRTALGQQRPARGGADPAVASPFRAGIPGSSPKA